MLSVLQSLKTQELKNSNRRIFQVAQRVERKHVFFHPFVGCFGSHFPARAAGRHDFYQAGTFALHRVFESFADSFLRLADSCNGVHRLAGDIASALQGGCYFGHLQRITVDFRITSVGASGGFHADESGRRHLSTCHTVNGIVDKNDGDVITTVQGVNTFGSSDTCQVAIALICEYQAGHKRLMAPANAGARPCAASWQSMSR